MDDPGRLQRWVRFNGIGALGTGVQLALLGWLTRGTAVHYLWATAIAVEAAVLHNFWWHERWTWRDRHAGSRGVMGRATRFHLSNGAISLGGNLLLMRILTGSLAVDPVAANIAAILVCSLVNFAASEWLVFRRVAAAALLLLLVAHPAAAAGSDDAMMAVELRPHTVQAWNTYIERVESRFPATGTMFFALDAFNSKGWRDTAFRGTVVMAKIEAPRPGDPAANVDDGKIHHWAGAIFVPGMSVDTLLARLSSLAGQEQQYYQDVLASRLLQREKDHYRIFMKIQRTKFVTATFNTEHDVDYRRLGPARASAKSVATRIAQLDGAGTTAERELKPGSDSGYLWRLNAYWRYEAVNGGVLIECESVSLSRGIPFLARVFVTGAVESIARESLERTLTGLKRYLTAAAS